MSDVVVSAARLCSGSTCVVQEELEWGWEVPRPPLVTRRPVLGLRAPLAAHSFSRRCRRVLLPGCCDAVSSVVVSAARSCSGSTCVGQEELEWGWEVPRPPLVTRRPVLRARGASGGALFSTAAGGLGRRRARCPARGLLCRLRRWPGLLWSPALLCAVAPCLVCWHRLPGAAPVYPVLYGENWSGAGKCRGWRWGRGAAVSGCGGLLAVPWP